MLVTLNVDERSPGPRIDGRERLALWLLAPLLAFLVVVALLAPWGAPWSVDNRTYLEMVGGVTDTGLPFTRNGDFERYRELRAPFNVGVEGKLWGFYPPLFAYVAAPAAMLGGASYVTKLNVLLTAALALCVFFLARLVVRRSLVATAASYVVVLSSPALIVTFETLAQPLALVLITLACLAAVASIEADRPKANRLALLAGCLGGLAVMTHLIALPMIVMLILGLAVVVGDSRASVPRFLPDRVALTRMACAAGAFAVTLVPLSILNHVRFGTWNPISYGPCVWDHCTALGQDLLTPKSLIFFALPAAPWALGVLVAAYFARRSPRALAGVAVVAALVLLPSSVMRERVLSMLRMIYGYAVDVSNVDFHMSKVDFNWFCRTEDGLGNIHCGGGVPYHGTAVKSMLQSTPILALAAIAPFGRRGEGARLLLLLFPVVGLFSYFILFARFEGAAGFGFPYLFLRYTVPAVPLLTVIASSVVSGLPWRRWHGALLLAVAVAGIAYFTRGLIDGPLLRRVIELRVTLLLAALSVGLTWGFLRSPGKYWGPAACVAIAACVGTGMAVNLGVDAFIGVQHSNSHEDRLRRVAALTPHYFALVGWSNDMDPLLALRVDHDIHYLDLDEARGSWVNFRELIDFWTKEERPIYGAFPANGTFHWPYADWDVPAVLIDEKLGLWRIGPPRAKAPPRPPKEK